LIQLSPASLRNGWLSPILFMVRVKEKLRSSPERIDYDFMNTKYLIDSSAWIEYYLGENVNLKVLIETEDIATPVLVIAELSDKFAREGEDFNGFFKFIHSRAKVIPLDIGVALDSGSFKIQMRKKFKQFGLADALIYLSAEALNAQLVTCDIHFNKLDGAILFPR